MVFELLTTKQLILEESLENVENQVSHRHQFLTKQGKSVQIKISNQSEKDDIGLRGLLPWESHGIQVAQSF